MTLSRLPKGVSTVSMPMEPVTSSNISFQSSLTTKTRSEKKLVHEWTRITTNRIPIRVHSCSFVDNNFFVIFVCFVVHLFPGNCLTFTREPVTVYMRPGARRL